MDELVARLSDGTHRVALGGSPGSLEELRTRVNDIGYVFVKFVETRGGTELGLQIDKSRSDLSHVDFVKRTGTAHVEGTLTLNYVKVRCVVDLEASTLAGTGQLRIFQ